MVKLKSAKEYQKKRSQTQTRIQEDVNSTNSVKTVGNILGVASVRMERRASNNTTLSPDEVGSILIKDDSVT